MGILKIGEGMAVLTILGASEGTNESELMLGLRKHVCKCNRAKYEKRATYNKIGQDMTK